MDFFSFSPQIQRSFTRCGDDTEEFCISVFLNCRVGTQSRPRGAQRAIMWWLNEEFVPFEMNVGSRRSWEPLRWRRRRTARPGLVCSGWWTVGTKRTRRTKPHCTCTITGFYSGENAGLLFWPLMSCRSRNKRVEEKKVQTFLKQGDLVWDSSLDSLKNVFWSNPTMKTFG